MGSHRRNAHPDQRWRRGHGEEDVTDQSRQTHAQDERGEHDKRQSQVKVATGEVEDEIANLDPQAG